MMKALIIEDDYNTAEAICLRLQELWPDAQSVSTPFGQKGIDMVKSEAPDIVILDLWLPDMIGMEAGDTVNNAPDSAPRLSADCSRCCLGFSWHGPRPLAYEQYRG